MPIFVNIYDDEQSELILNEEGSTATNSLKYSNMGEFVPQGLRTTTHFQNAFFLEMNVFDANNSYLCSLNSGRPLLIRNNGTYHLGDYHKHEETYMMGKKHIAQPHELLTLVRPNQLNVFPRREDIGSMSESHQYMIKLSEVFDIMKNLPNVNVTKDTNYKIQYGVFRDLMTMVGANLETSIIETGGYSPGGTE